MCLITKNKVRVTQRDVTIFRDVRVLTKNTWCGWIYDYVDFPFNEIVTARTFDGKEITNLIQIPTCDSGWYSIQEGFHSYRFSPSHICIIPKGSEICYGIGGEVVSTKIIVFSNYKEYFKYKWKKSISIF